MKPPSNIELKQVLIDDYSRNAKRVGLSPDMAVLERQVLDDLNMVDQYEAELATKPVVKAAPKKRDVRTDELEQELQSKNLRATMGEAPKDRGQDIICDAVPKSEKAVRMFGRIKQILRPRGDIGAMARRGNTIAESTIECTDPKLALEFLELWTWHGPLRALASSKNRFYWLNDLDAARLFVSELEKICDKSTGRFGPWWVK